MSDMDEESLSPIEGEDAEIRIPREVLANVRNGKQVRMASLLFRNKSGLLPARLEDDGNDNSRSVC